MSVQSEAIEALSRSFFIALLLTGNIKDAEAAVLDGIAASDFEDISGDNLLLETSKAALRRHSDGLNESEQTFSTLPREVRRVLALGPSLRRCFVLRVLMGMDPERCAGILRLSVPEVEDSICTALKDLPLTLVAPVYPQRTIPLLSRCFLKRRL